MDRSILALHGVTRCDSYPSPARFYSRLQTRRVNVGADCAIVDLGDGVGFAAKENSFFVTPATPPTEFAARLQSRT